MTRSGIVSVAREEWRAGLRAYHWRVLLGEYFALLLVFTIVLRVALYSAPGGDRGSEGDVVLGGLMLFVLALAVLVVPEALRRAGLQDRDRVAPASLRESGRTAGEVAVGRFAATWATALVFLGPTVPLVAYAVTQGGLSPARLAVVTGVVAVLLGTLCTISLWASAGGTTASRMPAYLVVLGLSVGTLVAFVAVTALTKGTYQEHNVSCEPALPEGTVPDRICTEFDETFTQTGVRTDRTWPLLAANPFVVLADAAPEPPPESARRPGLIDQDLDPLGAISRDLRRLRQLPRGELDPAGDGFASNLAPLERPKPLWPVGLAINVGLAAGALWLITRRLRSRCA